MQKQGYHGQLSLSLLFNCVRSLRSRSVWQTPVILSLCVAYSQSAVYFQHSRKLHVLLPADVCNLSLSGLGELTCFHCVLCCFVSGSVASVVYPHLIAYYCALHKQIQVRLHGFKFSFDTSHCQSFIFPVRHSGDPSCTDFCCQQAFAQDRID